jgi:hypothetical protein
MWPFLVSCAIDSLLESNLDPHATGSKCSALDETDAGDPGKAVEALGKLQANREQQGRLFDAAQR